MSALIIKPYRVTVSGFAEGHVYYTRSRQKALAESWRGYSSVYENCSFGDFMRIARVEAVQPSERFGGAFTINGTPAHYVSHNSQYVQFVRPGEDVILNAHPLDIDQPEARRGTLYYELPTDPHNPGVTG